MPDSQKVFESRGLHLDACRRVEKIKVKAAELLDLIEQTGPGPESSRLMAMARSELEICVMLAVKAASREPAPIKQEMEP